MDSDKNTHIAVPVTMREELRKRARPHQAIAGVIQELLDLADKYQPLPKPPEAPPIIKEPNTVEENKNEPSKT